MTFIGSAYNFTQRKWAGVPKAIEDILNDIIDLAISDPLLPLLTAMREVLKARSIQASDNWIRSFCFRYMTFVNQYVRTWCRHRFIQTLIKSGIALDIWGDGNWNVNTWVRYHGPCTYEESLNIIADSQMTLNIGLFPRGLHDRVSTAMLNGAVVVTDPSTYYNEHFVDGEDSLSFDWKNLDELPHKIIDLLADEDRMQVMADRGRQKALAEHTWTHRAKKVIEQIQIYKAIVGI